MAVVLNLEEVLGKLDNLKELDIQDALEKSCFVVENAAKVKCPVDTGQLRASITHYVDGHTGTIGTNVEYAPYVEYGTGIFASNGKGRETPWSYQRADGKWITTQGNKPQPFLEPALNDSTKEIVEIFKQKIKEAGKNG